MYPSRIRNVLALWTIVLAAVDHAGAQQVTISPPVYEQERSSSSSYTIYPGGYPDQRMQLADGNLRGAPRVIERIELRRDTSPGYPMQGRGWQRVVLDLAPTDLSLVSEVFADNTLDVPTTVFDGPMVWSTSQSTPTWGTDGLTIPLSAPYLHLGDSDLLLDFRFEAGQRLDGTPWPAGSLMSYYLDGVSGSTHTTSGVSYLGNYTCTDSAQSQGAVQRIYLETHSTSSPSHPGQIFHYQETFNTAPDAMVLQAVSLTSSASGTSLNSCNQLHIDPAAIFIGRADNAGYARLSLGSVPFDPNLVGFPIHAQSGWWDSVNSRLRLTNAASATVQPIPSPLSWNNLLVTTTTQVDPLSSPTGMVTHRGIPFLRYNWN